MPTHQNQPLRAVTKAQEAYDSARIEPSEQNFRPHRLCHILPLEARNRKLDQASPRRSFPRQRHPSCCAFYRSAHLVFAHSGCSRILHPDYTRARGLLQVGASCASSRSSDVPGTPRQFVRLLLCVSSSCRRRHVPVLPANIFFSLTRVAPSNRSVATWRI